MFATRLPTNALLEPPIGIAPRFPALKSFLKSYTLGWEDWESESIPLLQRYGAEGAGFEFSKLFDNPICYSFNHAGTDLEKVSMALRWHALQAALASDSDSSKRAAAKKKAAKTPVRDKDAAVAEYRKQAASKRYLGQMSYARSYLDADNTEKDLKRSDEEISGMDWEIACALAMDGFAAQEIAHAILACSPHLSARKNQKEASYACETAEKAIGDPVALQLIADRAAAQSSKESGQAHIGADWRPAWHRAVAYCYWACQMRTLSGMGLFQYSVGTVGNCLVLGWHDWALSLAKRAKESIGHDCYAAAQDKQRTQFFLLRLIDDWQGKPEHKYPPAAYDDPLLAALLEQWRTPDPAQIAPVLLAACDRHTHHAKAVSDKTDPDFPDQAWWYDPFEILGVLYLRKLEGLENPVLEHPLLATPIGTLPPLAPKYSDELLEAVINQAGKERPELAEEMVSGQ
jgi:hypothetical protein